MQCHECGYQNYEGEFYCSECGAILGDETIIAHSKDFLLFDKAYLIIGNNEFEIKTGKNIIGRHEADINISDPDNYVSRKHCIISLSNGKVYLCDKSLNGTYVNGERALSDTEVELDDGDEICFAKVSAKIKLN